MSREIEEREVLETTGERGAPAPDSREEGIEIVPLEEMPLDMLEELEEQRATRLEVASGGGGMVRITPAEGESLGDACRRLLRECHAAGRPYVVVLS